MGTKAIIFVFLVILIVSCNKEVEIIEITGEFDITDECEFYNNILSMCFRESGHSEYDKLVFRTNDSYQEFGDKIRIYLGRFGCDTAKLPIIDFF